MLVHHNRLRVTGAKCDAHSKKGGPPKMESYSTRWSGSMSVHSTRPTNLCPRRLARCRRMTLTASTRLDASSMIPLRNLFSLLTPTHGGPAQASTYAPSWRSRIVSRRAASMSCTGPRLVAPREAFPATRIAPLPASE